MARKILVDCMGLKKGERVLVVTDTEKKEIGEILFQEAVKLGDAMLIVMKPTGRHGAEPPKEVAYAMEKFDVVLCPTLYSLTHTKARKRACDKGARIATMPGITKDMFLRAIDVDYKKMEKRGKSIAKALEKKEIKVRTASGTDIKFFIDPKHIYLDLGLYHEPGDYGNLPAGEVFAPIVYRSGDGIIVIDHMGDICKPKTKVSVRNGVVQEVVGDDAFKKRMWSLKGARYLGEFGIGINDKAVISGNILEDEKVFGTCHIAFGSNFDFGGRIKGEVHWDAILMRPTIYVGKEKIMDEGVLLV